MPDLVPSPALAPDPVAVVADPSEAWETGAPAVASLSPSRAGDFMTCPLLYRFRVLDRIPEKPSAAAMRGTLVHQVLDDLFDLPAEERTLRSATSMIPAAWDTVQAEDSAATELFASAEEAAQWLATAEPLLETYFRLEDPRSLEPAERELRVEATLDDGLVLRGYVDRLDRNARGDLRIVDYKTGKAPTEGFEQKALFQMRFYALVLWRATGVVPTLLQLLYLGSEHVLGYEPDETDLLATERKVKALWAAIQRAYETGDWRASPSRLCDWCDHQSRCPAFGGTPPPLPTVAVPRVPTTAGTVVHNPRPDDAAAASAG